jgi:hypothetical protein
MEIHSKVRNCRTDDDDDDDNSNTTSVVMLLMFRHLSSDYRKIGRADYFKDSSLVDK